MEEIRFLLVLPRFRLITFVKRGYNFTKLSPHVALVKLHRTSYSSHDKTTWFNSYVAPNWMVYVRTYTFSNN